MDRIESNNSRQQFLLCKVCLSGVITHGNRFCEACITFFKRNRKRIDLQCKGSENPRQFLCLNNALAPRLKEDFQKTTRSGQIRRNLCSACRMEKYRLVINDDSSSHNNNSNNNNNVEDIVDICPGRSSSQSQLLLNNVVAGCNEFLDVLENCECRKLNNMSFKSDLEVFKYITQDLIFVSITAMKKLASKFDFYQNMTISDRRKIFMNTRFAPVCCEGLLKNDNFYVSIMPSDKLDAFFKMFPSELGKTNTIVLQQARKSWSFIKGLNLDHVEKCFLLTFLFFDGKFDFELSLNYIFISSSIVSFKSSLSPDGRIELDKALFNLHNTYESYLRSINYHDVENRLRTMRTLVQYTFQEANWRMQFAARVKYDNSDANVFELMLQRP